MPILTLTTRLDDWHTTALPYCRPTTEPSSPTKHLISPESAGPAVATSVALEPIKRRQAMMVALSYFFESAASSSELMAALSVAAVAMAVDTPTSFSEPMKKGVALSSATMNLTLAVAEATEAVAEATEANRAMRAAVARAKKDS